MRNPLHQSRPNKLTGANVAGACDFMCWILSRLSSSWSSACRQSAQFCRSALLRTMRLLTCLCCIILVGCSTEFRGVRTRQSNEPTLHLFWGANNGCSAFRFLSARIALDEEIRVEGDDFLSLVGRIEMRGTNFVADLEGSTGQQSQCYRGNMTLGKPVFAQGGAASGGAGPQFWFLLATNWDCRRVLEHVNAVSGLTGPPFYHPPAGEPTAVSNTATRIDPAIALPQGNQVVDPVTGLPLSRDHAKE